MKLLAILFVLMTGFTASAQGLEYMFECTVSTTPSDLRNPSKLRVEDIGFYDYVLKTYDSAGNIMEVFQIPDVSGYQMSWYRKYIAQKSFVSLSLRSFRTNKRVTLNFNPSPTSGGKVVFVLWVQPRTNLGSFECVVPNS
jgi:hypothetical protein